MDKSGGIRLTKEGTCSLKLHLCQLSVAPTHMECFLCEGDLPQSPLLRLHTESLKQSVPS